MDKNLKVLKNAKVLHDELWNDVRYSIELYDKSKKDTDKRNLIRSYFSYIEGFNNIIKQLCIIFDSIKYNVLDEKDKKNLKKEYVKYIEEDIVRTVECYNKVFSTNISININEELKEAREIRNRITHPKVRDLQKFLISDEEVKKVWRAFSHVESIFKELKELDFKK